MTEGDLSETIDDSASTLQSPTKRTTRLLPG